MTNTELYQKIYKNFEVSLLADAPIMEFSLKRAIEECPSINDEDTVTDVASRLDSLIKHQMLRCVPAAIASTLSDLLGMEKDGDLNDCSLLVELRKAASSSS